MDIQSQRSVPLEVGRAEGARVWAKHPDTIPIIVERTKRSQAPELYKKNYLVPFDLTVIHLYFLIRQFNTDRLFFFVLVSSTKPKTQSMVTMLFKKCQSDSATLVLMKVTTGALEGQ
uniref:Uncharacterized protein n=1 Tax=Amphilophus citrinellus TaxID=61819 RepID=A0A3Q0SH81_AMPCI